MCLGWGSLHDASPAEDDGARARLRAMSYPPPAAAHAPVPGTTTAGSRVSTQVVGASCVHYNSAMRERRWSAFAREYRRTWRARLASVLLLVPVLWLSILLLRVPAGSALSVPALLIDRLVVVSTAVVLPVAVLLLLVLPVSGMRAAAIVAGTVSGIVGLPTLLAAIDPPRKALPVGLAVLSVVCGLTLIALPLSTSLQSRRWRLSLLAPLSLLPIIQFWQRPPTPLPSSSRP
jgi:hypothetical protein